MRITASDPAVARSEARRLEKRALRRQSSEPVLRARASSTAKIALPPGLSPAPQEQMDALAAQVVADRRWVEQEAEREAAASSRGASGRDAAARGVGTQRAPPQPPPPHSEAQRLDKRSLRRQSSEPVPRARTTTPSPLYPPPRIPQEPNRPACFSPVGDNGGGAGGGGGAGLGLAVAAVAVLRTGPAADAMFAITPEHVAHYRRVYAEQVQELCVAAAAQAQQQGRPSAATSVPRGLPPAAAARILALSGLPRAVLSHVYGSVCGLGGAPLVEERPFVAAMHVVACVARLGAPLPQEGLPAPLRHLVLGGAPHLERMFIPSDRHLVMGGAPPPPPPLPLPAQSRQAHAHPSLFPQVSAAVQSMAPAAFQPQSHRLDAVPAPAPPPPPQGPSFPQVPGAVQQLAPAAFGLGIPHPHHPPAAPAQGAAQMSGQQQVPPQRGQAYDQQVKDWANSGVF
jgi:hypothetical protein